MPFYDQENRRDKELNPRRSSSGHEDLLEEFYRVSEGFRQQAERSDRIMDNWDIYNCVLNSNQIYNGNASLYVPIVRNAIQARKTRFLNQIFPTSGRYIDATSTDGFVPHNIVALLEDYVRKTRLRTEIMAALLRNGDLEGHYHLYTDWNRTTRFIASRETIAPEITFPGLPGPLRGSAEPIERMSYERIDDDQPAVEVIHDTDVLVLPVTSASVTDALYSGGSVTLIRRWTKRQVEDMIAAGELRRAPGEQLLEISRRMGDDTFRNIERELSDAAGIRSRGKYFQVYETWQLLDCGSDWGRLLARSYYGGYDLVLSCRRNPYWNDKCPLISCPQEKVTGVFKGLSQIQGGIDSIQYQANDIANQAADSATYSMMPIVMTDPAKNPRTSTMILNLAAVWEVDPRSTQFVSFPKLWQDGIAIIQNYTALVFQSMGVNPAMMPQSTGRGPRRNQAEVAMEQQIDIMTTAEACSVLEEGILSPLIQTWMDHDHQFRDQELTVRTYGELGALAKLESVPPLQTTNRYAITWFGVEQARNAQAQQQMIAFINVARGMNQDLQQAGYRLNPAPIIEHAAGNVFGWRMGRLVLEDQRRQLTMDPSQENELLEQGFNVNTHALDQDPQHIQAHMPLTQHPDLVVSTNAKIHVQAHQAQMTAKSQAQAAAQMQQMLSGPGGQPGQPGQFGQSRTQRPRLAGAVPGSQPQPPRPLRSVPGTIGPDQMPAAGAIPFPRRVG